MKKIDEKDIYNSDTRSIIKYRENIKLVINFLKIHS